ncbi:MAG: HD domain-containing protein [Oscillospiraceae bacterium]|nr:HD domain-containing protein [Oscillospiraceae bacterium]
MEKKEHFSIDSILEDMSAGILILKYDGQIILHNPAAERILGLPESALKHSSISRLLQSASENDTLFAPLLESLQQKKSISKTLPYFRNGEMMYVHLMTDPLGSGRTGMIAEISDITDETLLFIANKRLANQITNLMNSFVEVMVTAIEEESKYNANHTKSMVQYAKKYLAWLESEGKLTELTTEPSEALLMSIWLHDIGKLLVPHEIMDKPTRLGSAEKDVMHRIETALLLLKIQMLEQPEQKPEAEKKMQALADAKELIQSANASGFLSDDIIETLRNAARIPCPAADGSESPLLSDSELEAITVQRGTLTAAERKVIESHVSLTGKLLSKVEFRGNYRTVPKWAAAHHELMDGSGYPDRLQGDEIPNETRLLTILDIYDALTAEDRPYKPPLKPEEAFAILRDMAKQGKLDSTILESFYESGAWQRGQSES